MEGTRCVRLLRGDHEIDAVHARPRFTWIAGSRDATMQPRWAGWWLCDDRGRQARDIGDLLQNRVDRRGDADEVGGGVITHAARAVAAERDPRRRRRRRAGVARRRVRRRFGMRAAVPDGTVKKGAMYRPLGNRASGLGPSLGGHHIGCPPDGTSRHHPLRHRSRHHLHGQLLGLPVAASCGWARCATATGRRSDDEDRRPDARTAADRSTNAAPPADRHIDLLSITRSSASRSPVASSRGGAQEAVLARSRPAGAFHRFTGHKIGGAPADARVARQHGLPRRRPDAAQRWRNPQLRAAGRSGPLRERSPCSA